MEIYSVCYDVIEYGAVLVGRVSVNIFGVTSILGVTLFIHDLFGSIVQCNAMNAVQCSV